MRRLLSGVVTAILAASTMALGAAPAWADDEDIRVKVELSGGTVVSGGSKQVTFTITNISDDELHNPVIEFAPWAWDRTKVDFPLDEAACTPDAGGWIGQGCRLEPNPILPGRTATFTTTLDSVAGATPGPAGRVRILVTYASGRDPQDFAEFPLAVVSGPAPDLYAFAADVSPFGPLDPGQSGELRTAFANQGDVAATDVRFTATVPAGASFDEGPMPGCEFAARRVTCDFGDDVLPVDSGLIPISFMVHLGEDAKPGVHLTGGKVTITGRAATEAEQRRSARKTFQAAAADVDLADNDDEFRILVAGTPVKDEEDGGGAGGGGDEPTLPITGPSAGVGVAFVVVGVALLLLGRRRREGVE